MWQSWRSAWAAGSTPRMCCRDQVPVLAPPLRVASLRPPPRTLPALTGLLCAPVVCGITLLDLDHVAILGDTLTLIAGEKAGIIKKDVPAVSIAVQPSEALTVL